MGCGFSSSLSGRRHTGAGVRVIHASGRVEEFHGPGVVTVAHVTGGKDGGGHVLCSSAHLVQPGRAPFRPGDPLQPGAVYFLLPRSAFRSESSAVDLACLMNRLTALARKGGSGSGSGAAAPAGPSPLDALLAAATQSSGCHRKDQQPARPKPRKPAPWKPRLERIDESVVPASMQRGLIS
ncbi:hypothetical protein ACP70R_043614 [Stipagrostis hirtigluma subsp. patula]